MAKVKLENIMQNWEVHVPSMASQNDEFFSTFVEEWNRKETGIKAVWEDVGSILGSKKHMMKVEWNSYCCYIGTETFGTDLFCTWQLYHPDFSTQETFDNTFGGLFRSDFNEINEIRTFAAVCRDCVVKAAERLFDQTDQDRSGLARPSSGVLGPL